MPPATPGTASLGGSSRLDSIAWQHLRPRWWRSNGGCYAGASPWAWQKRIDGARSRVRTRCGTPLQEHLKSAVTNLPAITLRCRERRSSATQECAALPTPAVPHRTTPPRQHHRKHPMQSCSQPIVMSCNVSERVRRRPGEPCAWKCPQVVCRPLPVRRATTHPRPNMGVRLISGRMFQPVDELGVDTRRCDSVTVVKNRW